MGEFPSQLLREYARHTRPAFYSGPPLELIQKLLIIVSSKRRVLVFVDALDEQSHQSEHELGEILWKLADGAACLNVFAASRTHHAGVHKQPGEEVSQIRLEDHVVQVDTDIRRYLKRRLQSNRDLEWLSSRFLEVVLELLSSRSQGM